MYMAVLAVAYHLSEICHDMREIRQRMDAQQAEPQEVK
jgi:hypothetical protein